MQLWLFLCTMACSSGPALPEVPPDSRLPPGGLATADAPFEPLPFELHLDGRKVALGRELFEDPLLAGDGKTTCASCHDLQAGGVMPHHEARSNHPTAPVGGYNVPTIFNVAFNFKYNWQAVYDTLESHLGGPMMSQTVMNAGSWPALVRRLKPAYDGKFKNLGYGDGVTEEGIREVLAAYQRSLITPDARFDQFLRGEIELEPLEQEGYDLFLEIGCASCHQGVNVGGNMVQKFGVMENPFDRPVVELDFGRLNVTGDPEDAYVFRVPSLRNVAVTPPYFHDGDARTLDAAVVKMARVQLGYNLDEDQVKALVAFLNTLTGTWQGRPVSPPAGW